MKEYIIVSHEVATQHLGLAVCSIAHSALVAHDKWAFVDNDFGLKYQEWFQTSFKKVVCIVPDATLFQIALAYPAHAKITESALDNRLMAIVLHPAYTAHEHEYLKSLPLFQ